VKKDGKFVLENFSLSKKSFTTVVSRKVRSSQQQSISLLSVKSHIQSIIL